MKKSDNDCLNNTSPTFPTNKTVYIICAAIWVRDGKEYSHQPRNVDSGIIICGRRHHNCLLTLKELDQHKRMDVIRSGNEIEQGFMTTDDRFVTRKEAGEIAFKAGQTNKLQDCLFSEHLY